MSPTETAAHEPDVFEYFRKGREGVKERFAEKVRGAIKEHGLGWSDAIQLERALSLQRGTVFEIVSGNLDAVNYENIQALMSALDITIEEGFGDFEVPAAEIPFWNTLASQAGFGQVAAIGATPWPSCDKLKLFILLRAFKRL